LDIGDYHGDDHEYFLINQDKKDLKKHKKDIDKLYHEKGDAFGQEGMLLGSGGLVAQMEAKYKHLSSADDTYLDFSNPKARDVGVLYNDIMQEEKKKMKYPKEKKPVKEKKKPVKEKKGYYVRLSKNKRRLPDDDDFEIAPTNTKKNESKKKASKEYYQRNKTWILARQKHNRKVNHWKEVCIPLKKYMEHERSKLSSSYSWKKNKKIKPKKKSKKKTKK